MTRVLVFPPDKDNPNYIAVIDRTYTIIIAPRGIGKTMESALDDLIAKENRTMWRVIQNDFITRETITPRLASAYEIKEFAS